MTIFMLRSAAAVLLAVLFVASPASADRRDELTRAQRKELTRRLEQAESRYGVVSQAVVLLRDGKELYSGARGLASVELSVPATPETVYPLFSTSKLITVVTLMQQVEAGRVELDAPVSRYLPDLPASWGRVTVRQCLSHQSGLPDYATVPPSQLPRSPEEVLRQLAPRPFDFEPGTATRYNQTNYLLLSRIIEKTTGRPFVDAVKAGTLAPLGLERMRYGGEHDLIPGRATTYQPTPRGLALKDGFDFPEYSFPNAGLNASARDLARWATGLLGGKLLPPRALASLWPAPKASGEHVFSNGWEFERSGKITAVGHGGGGNVDLRHFIDEASGHTATVIYLTNGAQKHFSPEEMSVRLAEVVLPGALSPQLALKDAMYDALERDDAQGALERYHAFRSAPATRATSTEGMLNTLGYELFAAFGPKRALPVFALNVEEHPSSGNAHDSLGEAYLALGDLEHAREHYTRAVELDPHNENARRILGKLSAKGQPAEPSRGR